jgi:hypothetical protein
MNTVLSQEIYKSANLFSGNRENGTIPPKPSTVSEIYLSYAESRALRYALPQKRIHDCASALAITSEINDIFATVLAKDTIQRLKQFSQSTSYALIVRHLPIDEFLPPTPYTSDPGVQATPLATASILGVFGIIGSHPLAYQGENDDSFVRHVVPKRDAEMALSSYGSRMDLGMHADNPHLPLSTEPVTDLSACPEFLSLTGIRCQLSVPTRIVSAEETLATLPNNVIETLMQHVFTIKRPDSFGDQGYRLIAPLVSRATDGQYLCRYNKANVAANTPEASQALSALERAIQAQTVQHVALQQGDMLIFKNQQTFHARDAFAPRFDGMDRWMMRVFGVRDMSRTIPVTPCKSYIVRA